jgi:hypothetical protein
MDHDRKWEKREGRPPFRAHSFTLRQCGNPHCGAHLVALTAAGNPLCDIAIPSCAAPSFIQALQDLLYVRAVEREDEDDIPF